MNEEKYKKKVEEEGIEPAASCMRSKRSTPELHPLSSCNGESAWSTEISSPFVFFLVFLFFWFLLKPSSVLQAESTCDQRLVCLQWSAGTCVRADKQLVCSQWGAGGSHWSRTTGRREEREPPMGLESGNKSGDKRKTTVGQCLPERTRVGP
jgi:hypothetical protein